jgi:hypothetical protein
MISRTNVLTVFSGSDLSCSIKVSKSPPGQYSVMTHR